jgi:hypothetical protein
MPKFCASPKCFITGLIVGIAGTFCFYQWKMYKAKKAMVDQGITKEQISSFCK